MSEPSISVLPIKQTNLKKITLKNDELEVVLLNYGARLHQVFTPDRNGLKENVLLSYDNLQDVLSDQSFFGATVGPVAGRIRNGEWETHQLEKNNGHHHIHGGTNGWSFQYWEVEVFKSPQAVGVVFYLKDTSSGYPGPITATVTYQLEGNKLVMITKANSVVETICNPTNHAYFNLSGNGKRDIDTHQLQIQLDSLLLLDHDNLPTGETIAKEDLPIDFHKSNPLTEILSKYPTGLDDVFLLNSPKLTKNSLTLSEETSGRQMNIATTNKSMVLFSTTGFDEELQINGKKMHSNFGLAIEPQEIPDIVHFPAFGSITLRPGQERISQTTYEFSTFT
ncbi:MULTISPECIES: aldose epimerase family protein [unclassified Enterococcus]|uniref:aldose epimerase family protein n=1 Tax=unclassified Enterococcus TaxID=2608891 RepID=UPI001A9B5D53|nr:aldose epimerase family protein [Enterococcus sp. DIV1271a]MBO1299798.1 galactose mutarotase [Enterococcus sp. DIV1271a]